MKNAVIALVVVVGILGGFYGGYKVGQSNVSANGSTSSNSTRGSGGASAQGGRGALTAACPSPGATPAPGAQALARGTITNLSATSMTVSNTACDVTVKFTTTTIVQKSVAASTSDLADNQTVTVTGTRQADGSILATAIAVGGAGFIRGSGSSPGAGG
jgi:uncharacterized protein DUF5666